MQLKANEKWINYFSSIGYSEAYWIASGMEGSVYMLIPNKLIAKVWTGRTAKELEKLKIMFDPMERGSKAMTLPSIQEIKIIDGVLLSFETYVDGKPLANYIDADAPILHRKAVDATIEVLDFLKHSPANEALKSLGVLNEEIGLWEGHIDWKTSIKSIMNRRLTKYRNFLDKDVANLSSILEHINTFLEAREPEHMGIIHGDLCGCNIMVDESVTPTGILDFGFLTTYGDLAFDVAISAAIFNMYGKHSDAIEELVTVAFCKHFEYDRAVIDSYKMIYAILTSNAYSENGEDGHYKWCVNILNRGL